LIASALLSSCTSLCCDKASARIEADIAIATDRKEDAEAAQKDAYKRVAWAKDFGLDSDFPEKFRGALASLNPGDLAYDNMKYATAKQLYKEVSAILSDDFKARAAECRDEKAKVDLAIAKALEACADTLSPQRFKDAQDLYIKAKALKAADDLPNAIATCKKARAAFEYAGEYARVMKLRDSIKGCEVLKDYNREFLQAESKILEDETLWTHGTVKDYALGTSVLHEAGRQYTWIAEQCRKLAEEKRVAAEKSLADAALCCARSGMVWADEQRLDMDYAADYGKAKALLAEAESRYAAGDYVGAAASANQICSLFSDEYKGTVKAERDKLAAEKAAADKLAAEKALADGALTCARSGMAWADEQRLDVDYAADYAKVKVLLADAESKYAAGDYVGAAASANQICSLFSDEYRLNVKSAREKVLADGALACARSGMTWADEQRLDMDYAADYGKAKALLADAESKYAAGDYVGAAASANQVCTLFSDEYKGTVKAERDKLAVEKAAAEKAAADKLAAEKALADGAFDCAGSGMVWADEQRLDMDYAADYGKAKALLAEAESRYAAGDYVGAAENANQVCTLFSDEYKATVKAERDKLAAEKAAADKLAKPGAAPETPVIKTSPEYFSPDNDGSDDVMLFDTIVPDNAGVKSWVLEVFEEYIVDPSAKTYSVAKRSFRIWKGEGVPPGRVVWNGKSDKDELVQSGTTYPYTFSYMDSQDRVTTTQGAVIIGIIAQKSGDTINIKLPSLVFRADKADFLDLDSHVVERNNLLIGKLAESLKKYSDYNITVEGHANNVGKIMGYSQKLILDEEKSQVMPLSTARAAKLRTMLIGQGIASNVITAIGYGSSQPVVSFKDAVNRWKNRRVEFVLTKRK